jgi:hypothetical protein
LDLNPYKMNKAETLVLINLARFIAG